MTPADFNLVTRNLISGGAFGRFAFGRWLSCVFLSAGFAAVTCLGMAASSNPPAKSTDGSGPAAQEEQTATLHGHVLGILSKATVLPRTPAQSTEPLTLTVVLNLSDPAGFDKYRRGLDDPKSPNFHKRISRSDLTARFGPTQQAYDSVLAYLQQKGFTLVTGSATRRTLTVRGTRAQAESAFHVSINDHQLGNRTFHAISADPAVPKALAPQIRAIVGFSNLARWRPNVAPSPPTPASIRIAYDGLLTPAGSTNTGGLPPGLDGSGQTIGLIEFDNYNDSDVSNWLAFAGLPQKLLQQISRYPIAGGTSPSGCNPAANGCGTSEVLLDIAAALGTAPGANIIVFDAPISSDFAGVISEASAQIYTAGGGSTTTGSLGGTLSVSWAQCEPEISQSDALAISQLIYESTYDGIPLFASTGDNGSTCVSGDGTPYPNSIQSPADAPAAIAVGGTTLQVNSDNSYNSESWWPGGGFGVSQYLASEPPLGWKGAWPGSIPEVASDANGSTGIGICQAYGGNSPNCFRVGGTSLSAPTWAGIWTLARQAQADGGSAFYGGPGFYAYPGAFHSAASMTGPGNNFAHVGLGSPDITSIVSNSCVLEVNSVSPGSGPRNGGTKVTIRGQGFVGVEKVTFGGVAATNVTIHSDSKLTADSPAANGSQVDIQVVTPAGTSAKSSKDLFAYGGLVTNVSPGSGPVAGGTEVTVTGKGFILQHTTFEFGGSAATHVACSSSTKCTMTAPSHDAGTVDVLVKANGVNSESTPADHFTFVPSITRIVPRGGAQEGTQVTVKGQGFTGQSKFDFGGSEVSPGVCASSTNCTMTAPYHSPGRVYVTVETNGAKSAATLAVMFTYVAPAITKISPSKGPTVGGESVTLTGSGFYTVMTVKFGDTIATSLTNGIVSTENINCPSEFLCYVTSPAGTGSVYVTANVAGVTSRETVANLYTYAVFPSVADLSPYKGPVTGGITVTITGTNFSTAPGGTTFQFGSLPATNVTCAISTQCTVTAPVRAASAAYLEVPVTATVNGLTSVTSFLFDFGTPLPPPR